MPSGGHSRSGPAPSPTSGASDRKGLTFNNLPAEGYAGEIPAFPGPTPAARVAEWWSWVWRTPQAALWATPQWSWVIPAVADWCLLKAKAETSEVPAALMTAIRQREGDILLSHDALLRAGYKIAVDELAAKRDDEPRPESAKDRAKRLRAVGDA